MKPTQHEDPENYGLPENWQPVDAAPVIPGEGAPPSQSQAPGNYFAGSLAPVLQHDSQLVKSGYPVPQSDSVSLMPLGPSGVAGNVSAIKSVVTQILASGGGNNSDNDPYLLWKAVWNSFSAYSVNDVVLFNISAYVAIRVSTNSRPDANPLDWTLLSKNINLRGQWSPGVGTSTISYVQSNTSATVSQSFVTPNLAGSVLFALVSVDNTVGGATVTGVTDTLGNTWTQLGTITTTALSGAIYLSALYIVKNAIAGSPTVTFTATNLGVVHALMISEFTGASTTAPQDDYQSGTVSPINLTTTTFNGVVALFGHCPNNIGSVVPAGFTLATTVASTAEYYKVISTTGIAAYPQVFSPSVGANATPAALYGIALKSAYVPVGVQYYPADVVLFLGSTYLCLSATTGSPVGAPASWGLLAQGAGGVTNITGLYTPAVSDYGKILTNTTSSAYTLMFPDIPPLSNSSGSAWWVAVNNSGTGTITIDPSGALLDGVTTPLVLGKNQGVLVYTDGTNYFTERGYGTVTNLTMPAIFTVGTIGNTGILPITLATEPANTIFAGPASGGAVAPTFRSLATGDIPLVNAAIFNRRVISTTTYLTVLSDIGKALDVQTSSATAITIAAPAGAPAFVQAVQATGTTASLVQAYSSNNIAGNLLVMVTRVYNGGSATYTVTDTLGNTWVKAPGGFLSHSTASVDLWYVANCLGGPNTVTLTITNPVSTFPRFIIAEYSGIATVSALDTQSGAQGTGTISNSGNIITAQASELLVGFTENETTSGTANTPNAGFSAVRAFTTNRDLYLYDQTVSSTGTYSFGSTWGVSVGWGDFIAAFKAPLSVTPFSGFIQNNGTAVVTITPANGLLINGKASIALSPGQGVTIASDGAAFTAILGSQSWSLKVKTSAYTAIANDFVLCSTAGGGFNVILPLSASNSGSSVIVKKTSSDANTLTILPTGADTIDGNPNAQITTSKGSATFVADGVTTWEII